MNKLVNAALNGCHTPTAFTSEADYVAATGGMVSLDECICTGVATEAPGELLIAIYIPGTGMATARLDREAIEILAFSMATVVSANPQIGGEYPNIGTLQ